MPAVLLDACVLYPAALRDFVLPLVEAEVFTGHMTATILDECFRSVERKRPDLDPKRLRVTREAIEDAFGDHGVVALHLDAFLAGCVTDSPEPVAAVVHKQAKALRNPPTTVAQLLDRLAEQGLRDTVAALRRHLG